MNILKKKAHHNNKGPVFGKVILGAALVLTLVFVVQSCSKEVDGSDNSAKTEQLRVEMRQLWAEHMEWTYATVDAFFHDQNGLNAKLNRLLQNQQDIGNAIKPYYGDDAGTQLAALLTEHIQLAVPVLTAAQKGDNAGLEEGLDNWYANAQAVGDYYASINPKVWAQPEMRDMWKTHITQTVGYSVALLQNKLDDAIVQYQAAYDHMMEMGDDMAEGLANK